jgi:hypothetical protein
LSIKEFLVTQAQYRRPGTLWYVSDGYIWDDFPATYRTEPGRPLECSTKLFIYNPQETPAHITARLYHVDRTPAALEYSVDAGRIKAIELATLAEIPHRQPFWIVVESDIPVLPQAQHEDYRVWDPVPDALIAPSAYPGPLEDETTWIFPDCYQSASRADGRFTSWYERELLTMLNPNHAPVTARVRFFLRNRELGAEEEITIPGERVFALDMYDRHPPLLGTENGPPIRVTGDYAVRIDASAPVVAQTTRRCRWTGQPSIVGARSLIAFPLRGAGHKLWYYPGGAVIDRGVLPRNTNCDVTWNLLFTHNLHEREPAQATVAFHKADGSVTNSAPIAIPPLKSDLAWLHLKPWLGVHTNIDQPFSMVVTADQAVVPEVTCAEFEMWSQVCPGAMSAANFYPGPLSGETTWWLGIGQAGGNDELNTEWQQSYHFFNPGDNPVSLTVAFCGLDRPEPIRHTLTVGPGAVAMLTSAEIADLPVGAPFAVQATGDGPFCPQFFARTFTRGVPYTRAMYSNIGIPMALR